MSCIKHTELWCLVFKTNFTPSSSWQQLPLIQQYPDINVSGSTTWATTLLPPGVPRGPGAWWVDAVIWEPFGLTENIPNPLCNLGALTFGNGCLRSNHISPHDSFLYLTHPPSHITSEDRWHFIGIFDYCYSHLNFSQDGGLWSKCSCALG